MAIFLGILKIIGIILLIILAIVVILLCLVLFVPIRYEASGRKEEKEMEGKAKVTWLLHALSFTIACHENGSDGVVKELRIFGIPLETYRNFFRKRRKDRRRRSRKKHLEKLRKKNPQQYEEMKAEAQARREAERNAREEEEKVRRAEEEARKENEGTSSGENDSEQASAEDSGRNLLTRIFSLTGKIWKAVSHAAVRAAHGAARVFTHLLDIVLFLYRLPGKIIAALRSFFGKIKALCRKVDLWASFVRDRRTHDAVKLILKKIKKLLKHAGPKKLSGEIRFGLDDPSKTGTVLAGACAFYPLYGKHVKLTPNFEKAEFSGHLEMKGRIFLYYAVFIALTTYFNKNVKYVVQFIKNVKEEKSNG